RGSCPDPSLASFETPGCGHAAILRGALSTNAASNRTIDPISTGILKSSIVISVAAAKTGVTARLPISRPAMKSLVRRNDSLTLLNLRFIGNSRLGDITAPIYSRDVARESGHSLIYP